MFMDSSSEILGNHPAIYLSHEISLDLHFRFLEPMPNNHPTSPGVVGE